MMVDLLALSERNVQKNINLDNKILKGGFNENIKIT